MKWCSVVKFHEMAPPGGVSSKPEKVPPAISLVVLILHGAVGCHLIFQVLCGQRESVALISGRVISDG